MVEEILSKKNLNKIFKNPWAIATIILVIALVVVLFANPFPGVSKNKAGEDVVAFLNSQTGGGVELIEINTKDSLYEVLVDFQGQQIPVYITNDGKYLVQGLVPLSTAQTNPNTNPNPQPQDIPKSDKPTVELVITSHCPYGLQGTKGILPVYELLGNKIDSSIRYFNIPSHGEKEEIEAKRAVCIREQQPEKFLDYLACYVKAGESESCLKETNIDETKLNSCLTNNIGDYYSGTSEIGLNTGSSPTLIINGQEVNSGRSASAYLDTICQAFTEGNIPAACSETLSSTTPSSGFGYSASGAGAASAAATC